MFCRNHVESLEIPSGYANVPVGYTITQQPIVELYQDCEKTNSDPHIFQQV